MLIHITPKQNNVAQDTIALLQILEKVQEEKQYENIDEEQKRRVYFNEKY